MRLSSFRYLCKEGLHSLWQNRFMSLASIGVLISCLLLTGGAYLVFENIGSAFKNIYAQNKVLVYVDPTYQQEQLDTMQQELEKIVNVSDVSFMSRDEVLDRYKEDFSDALYEELQQNNPMQDVFVVTLSDLSKFDVTVPQIEKLTGVDEISSSRDIAQTLTKLRSIIISLGAWIIVLLLIVSLFIIVNTIKLTVYSRRLQIYIMKSVGATNNFVRMPFMIEGISLGLISGGLAYGLLYFIYDRLSLVFDFDGFRLVEFSSVWLVLLVGFLLAGLLIGALGSAISMGRYLREKGGRTHEIQPD